MKKHFLSLLLVLSLFKFGYAQVPSAIPYQAVVRNSNGNILPNHSVQLRFTIHDSITNGNVVYQETHSISTNGQGLVITNIGQGTSTTGTFSGINWGKNNKFVQTELSINNDNTFTDLGTTQFLSVPYALHSGNGMPNGNNDGEMLYWSNGQWVKVAPGSQGQTLTFCGGKPHWGACPPEITPIHYGNGLTDIDGNTYDTVSICNQVWMKQNLNVSRYRNGDIIPQVTDPTQWANLTTGAWCYYNNDSANRAAYGKLYNWYAVNDARGLAPEGWHVPSDGDWNKLVKCLDSNADTICVNCWQNTTAGILLKSTSGWNNGGNGTNTSDLTILPSGYCSINGTFGAIGTYGDWWSCSDYSTQEAWLRSINGGYAGVFRDHYGKNHGFSIRCVKDITISPTITLPTLSTDTVSSITTTSSTCGGNITNDGGGSITARGICWSTSNNPTIDLTTKTTDGTGTGSFTSSITGLSPNTTYFVRAYATNSAGTSYGSEISFTTQSVSNNTGVGVTDIDGNTYDTVRICNQTWTKKNLNVSRYRNGDIIPQVTDPTQWANLTTGAWCYYNNDSTNGAVYGKLYNWYAVNDPRGLAPEGWHVPSDGEWNKMTKCLDATVDTTIEGWSGTTIAIQLKNSTGWNSGGNGTNGSGFSGIPGGDRYDNGTFRDVGDYGIWWSASDFDIQHAWNHYIGYGANVLARYSPPKTMGFSVRLVKDEPLPIINEGLSDIDGNTYDTIRICNQTWTKKNLNVSRYRNGDIIPQVTDPTQWANLTTGAWCYYNNDSANGAVYGKLYNWYAVNDSRGLAPEGWHVPSDGEWTSLTNCLGGADVAGGKMKEAGTSHWSSPNTDATNSSGFSALPGVNKSFTGGAFDVFGYYTFYWSKSNYNQNESSCYFITNSSSSIINRIENNKYGFSVRLVKDEPPSTLNDGLVAYYPFNGNANDESGNGNNGTVYGATLTTDRLGNSLKALSFDGVTNSMAIPYFNQLEVFTGNFTLSFWIKNELSLNHLGAHIIYRSNGCFDFGMNGDNTMSFSKQGIQVIYTTNKIFTNNWNHVVINRDANLFKIYIDGILESAVTNSLQIQNVTENITIGKANQGGGNNGSYFFKGCLDDIRIYNRALTQEEISYLATH